MKQFCLNLNKDLQRPTIVLKGISAMIDTGAYIPVWTANEQDLIDKMGATLIKRDVKFRGFGGIAVGNLYKVNLILGELIFPDLPIISNDNVHAYCDLILSAPMFDKLIYEINMYTHKLTITVMDDADLVRNLKIVDTGGIVHVLCNSFINIHALIPEASRHLYPEDDKEAIVKFYAEHKDMFQ